MDFSSLPKSGQTEGENVNNHRLDFNEQSAESVSVPGDCVQTGGEAGSSQPAEDQWHLAI